MGRELKHAWGPPLAGAEGRHWCDKTDPESLLSSSVGYLKPRLFPWFVSSSDSQPGAILPLPRGYLMISGDIFGYYNWERATGIAMVLLNILQYIDQASTTKKNIV